jgi:hypothetical protein
MDLEQVLEIEWPWEMVPMEAVDEFIALIKDALPPGHELQSHDLFPASSTTAAWSSSSMTTQPATGS